MPDLNLRELAMLGSIAAVVLWMGVYPESFMAPMRKDVQRLVAEVTYAKPASDAQLARSASPAVTATAEGAHR